MKTVTHALIPATPGTRQELVSLHFGTPGAGPKVYIQGGLHAEEVPGLLVAHHLRGLLAAAEAEGRLLGEVVLVPAAIGMRGNVFGALGSRLGTQIHAGTFRWSNRVDTEAGQNAAAAMVSSVVVAAALAVLAKVVSVAAKGDAGKALLSAAGKADADLLVMGAYGHSRVRELVLGGVTKHVLQVTTIPALMVH